MKRRRSITNLAAQTLFAFAVPCAISFSVKELFANPSAEEIIDTSVTYIEDLKSRIIGIESIQSNRLVTSKEAFNHLLMKQAKKSLLEGDSWTALQLAKSIGSQTGASKIEAIEINQTLSSAYANLGRCSEFANIFKKYLVDFQALKSKNFSSLFSMMDTLGKCGNKHKIAYRDVRPVIVNLVNLQIPSHHKERFEFQRSKLILELLNNPINVEITKAINQRTNQQGAENKEEYRLKNIILSSVVDAETSSSNQALEKLNKTKEFLDNIDIESDSLEIIIARKLAESKQFRLALSHYEKIPLESQLYNRSLFEQSFINLKIQDWPKSLSLVRQIFKIEDKLLPNDLKKDKKQLTNYLPLLLFKNRRITDARKILADRIESNSQLLSQTTLMLKKTRSLASSEFINLEKLLLDQFNYPPSSLKSRLLSKKVLENRQRIQLATSALEKSFFATSRVLSNSFVPKMIRDFDQYLVVGQDLIRIGDHLGAADSSLNYSKISADDSIKIATLEKRRQILRSEIKKTINEVSSKSGLYTFFRDQKALAMQWEIQNENTAILNGMAIAKVKTSKDQTQFRFRHENLKQKHIDLVHRNELKKMFIEANYIYNNPNHMVQKLQRQTFLKVQKILQSYRTKFKHLAEKARNQNLSRSWQLWNLAFIDLTARQSALITRVKNIVNDQITMLKNKTVSIESLKRKFHRLEDLVVLERRKLNIGSIYHYQTKILEAIARDKKWNTDIKLYQAHSTLELQKSVLMTLESDLARLESQRLQ